MKEEYREKAEQPRVLSVDEIQEIILRISSVDTWSGCFPTGEISEAIHKAIYGGKE